MLVRNISVGALFLLQTVFLADKVSCICSKLSTNVSLVDIEDVQLEKHEDKSKLARLKDNCLADKGNTVRRFENIVKGGTIEVDCGNDVIYDVTVKAFASDKCIGLTHQLLTSSQDCVWKKRCNVTYEPDVIMFPFSPSCVGEEPSSLDLSYLCLTSETSIHNVKNTYQVIESESGMLMASSSTNSENHERRFRAVVRPPPSMTAVEGVLLEVLQVDVRDGSRISIEVDKTEYKIANNKCYADILCLKSFVFNVYHRNTIPSFHVKFRWYEENLKEAKKTISESVLNCQSHLGDEKVTQFPVIQKVTSNALYGILRSHARYPWNYQRPKGSNHFNSWTSFSHTLEPPNAGLDLVIQIVVLDLGFNDTLEVVADNKMMKVDEPDNMPRLYEKCKSFKVIFTVQHGEFPTKKGFLLRYEWIVNAISKSFNKAVIYDKKCEADNVVILPSATANKSCKRNCRKGKKCEKTDLETNRACSNKKKKDPTGKKKNPGEKKKGPAEKKKDPAENKTDPSKKKKNRRKRRLRDRKTSAL